MDRIRVLIVDNHPLFRLGIRAQLELDPAFLVVGEAESGSSAITMIPTCHPDVIVMDLHFQEGVSGLDTIRHIHQIDSHIAVLVITTFDDDYVLAAIQAGACGYMVKDTDPSDVVRAIHAVSRGGAIFSPSVANRFRQYLSSLSTHQTQLFPELTPREHEILMLLSDGYTNQAIATQLSLSDKTIRNQVSTIYGKLKVSDRASAIILTRERRMTTANLPYTEEWPA